MSDLVYVLSNRLNLKIVECKYCLPTLFPQSGSVVKKRIIHQARRLYVKRYKEKLHANKVRLSRLLGGLFKTL